MSKHRLITVALLLCLMLTSWAYAQSFTLEGADLSEEIADIASQLEENAAEEKETDTVDVPAESETEETANEPGASEESAKEEAEVPGDQSPLSIGAREQMIAKGQKIKLTAEYDTEVYGKKAKITWESSDKKVASVAAGTVTGVKPGTAVITCNATFEDGSTAEAVCNVTVYQPAASVTAKTKALTVPAGHSAKASAEVKPADAAYPEIRWSSSDEKVAVVDSDGNVKGISMGKAVITGTLNEPGVDKQKSVKINVTVTQGVSGISINNSLTVGKGKSEKLSAKVQPDNATNKKLTWTSSDPKIATVANGVVKGVATGTCTITAVAADGSGAEASCEVTVIQQVTSIKATASRYVVFETEMTNVTVDILPADATNKKVTYESEKPSIAKVDETGKVTGVSAGECNIVVTAADGSGRKVKCKVIVEPDVPVEATKFVRSGYFGYYNEYGITFKNLTKTKTISYLTFDMKYNYNGKTQTITGNYLSIYKIGPKAKKEAWWKLNSAYLTYSNNFRLYLKSVRFTDGTSRYFSSDGNLIGWFN